MRYLLVALVALQFICDPAPAQGDPRSGEIVRRAPVRGGGNTLGEVRLIRRGNASVVETVLRTALLRRVVAEIRDKEHANWQPDRSGSDDSIAYVKALEEVANELVREARRSQSRDPALNLLIEFSSSPSSVSVKLWNIDVEKHGDTFRITSQRMLRDTPVTRTYVDRNMRLIVADSFGISETEAAALLAPGTGRNEKDETKTESVHE